MNKLSELSKPAAFIVRSPRGDVAYRTISQTDADYIARKGYASEPLYSQEYVTDLLADLEASSLQCRGIEQERELFRLERTAHQLHAQALEQHIAEMERANQSQENHINQQQDRIDSLEKTNAGLGRGLAAAEQKLATPVRLPTEHELHQVACSECAGNCLELVESTVRAAGFTVEGDE